MAPSKNRRVKLAREKSLELFGFAETGDVEGCKRLLDAGADVNVIGKYECTPLHWAAQEGHVDVCKLMLDYGADLKAGGAGITPLHDAASCGHVVVCQLLLAYGADGNASSYADRETPLFFAAENGHAEACKVLIESGADVRALNIIGRTVLYRAVKDDHVDVCRVLINCDPALSAFLGEATLTPFQEAVGTGSTRSVIFFVNECGEDLTQTTSEGKTLSLIAKGPEMRALLNSLATEVSVRDALGSDTPTPSPSKRNSSPSLL